MEKEFYRNRDIFITGGSGVVGSAAIEKLLRSCDVGTIFVLLRPKKGMTCEQRLEKLLKANIFMVLRDTNPEVLKRIVAVPGDCLMPLLGITPEYSALMANVSIVLNCAATVNFDERLVKAIKVNVGGTYESLKFARTLKNLEIFMHVSTFYSNPYLEYIEEKVYDPPLDWRMCLKMIEDDSKADQLDILTRQLITGFPNTYTFTKNIAETLINDHRHEMPVAIFRPSIVVASMREPLVGFPTSPTGAMGLFILGACGIMKTCFLDPNAVFDFTPLDIGTKCMLFYLYHAHSQYINGRPSQIPMYLASSSANNTRTFHELVTLTQDRGIFELAPFEKSLMLPYCIYTTNPYYYMFLVYFKQLLPCLLIDGLIKACGHKPVLVPILRRAFVSLQVMEAFMFNNWKSKGFSLSKEQSELPRGSLFSIKEEIEKGNDVDYILEHIVIMFQQIRKITLKEDPKTIPRCRRILKIKYAVYYLIRVYLWYLVAKWVYFYIRTIFK